MLKECITEAATIEEALQMAAEQLNQPADALKYEVLQEPQKKTLGLFGGANAQIRAYVEETEPVTAAKAAQQYLETVLADMGLSDPTITLKEDENSCTLSVEGENLGFIIGRRGDTLDALQYLVGLVSNRVEEDYYRVTIDVGNYREKRRKSLMELAHKMAKQAAKTGRRHSLEAMNPYERRIVHTAVQEVEGATSWSVGSEPNRHVVIGPSDDNPVKNKPRSSGRRKNPNHSGHKEGGSRPERPVREKRDSDAMPQRPPRQIREFIPRSNPLPTADGATPVKTESQAESSATLYGRIDL